MQPLAWFLRVLIGVPPKHLSPSGMTEGSAVFEESQDGTGRLFDPLTEMTFRAAVLGDAFPNAGEIMVGSHRWPFGRIPYLYGARLIEYLDRNYGGEILTDYWRSDEWPFFLDERLGYSVPSYVDLYEDYKAELTARALEKAEELRQEGVTPLRRLTCDGQSKSFLSLGSAGELLYFARPPDRPSGLYRHKGPRIPEGTYEFPDDCDMDAIAERLHEADAAGGIASAGGRLVSSENFHFYPGYGLRYELHDGDLHRLRPGVSASYPSLSSDGKLLVHVERDDFERRLVVSRYDEGGTLSEGRVLYRTPFTGILQYTALSPDDSTVVFLARAGERGNGDLVSCPLSKGECRTLVRGSGTKIQPVFTPDGASVVFSSDADGIYNLYSADLASGEVVRLTRTLTGLFHPVAAKDALYALGYFAGGYDLVRIDYRDLSGEGATSLFSSAPAGPKTEEPFSEAWSETSYGGPLSIRPYVTGLLAGPSLLNLGLEARDPLERHTFSAVFSATSPEPSLYSFYDYDRYAAGLSLTYARNFRSRNRSRGCLVEHPIYRIFCDDSVFFSETANAELRHVRQGRLLDFQIAPGYEHRKLRNARRSRAVEYDARDLNLSGPTLTIALGHTHFYPRSVSFEHGFNAQLRGVYYTSPESLSNVDRFSPVHVQYGIVEGGFALYLPSFFSHHVNYFSAYGYASVGPDREIQRVPLNRFVRGIAYDKAPRNHSAAVGTYEYRLPLAWISDEIFEDEPEIMWRSLALGLFYDYGAVFDRRAYREDFVGAYGVSLSVGLNLLYLPMAEIKATIARGTREAGELQGYLSFDSGFSTPVGRTPAVLRPLRALPGHELEAGYFRSHAAGGVLR